MGSKLFRISPDLSLPLDAVTQTFAIMAKRGVGKTHTGSVMAEEMLKQGQPIVVYDPTGAWWGLKSSADGKRPGFPVVIFGGEHADVPLEETAGETIAAVIVERRLPAILDCGLMRKGARIRFMTDFCEALYHRNREPLHLFIDEAQTVAPQNLKAMPEIARLVGALEDIILQGRRRGLGMTVISPRPAIVNTSIRSACEILIAMQIVGPHDRKAIQEWVDLHGDDAERAKEMMASLSSLKRGQAWVWSPSWLELFTRTTFRKRETFDSSATPEVGSRVVTPRKMAEIDLAKLGAEIAATVERAKADDPRELRKQLAELQRQLQARPTAAPAKVEEKEIQVIKREHLSKLRKYAGELRKAALKIEQIEEAWRHNIQEGSKRIEELIKALGAANEFTATGGCVRLPSAPAKGQTVTISVSPPPRPTRPTAEGEAQLTRPQQRILDSLAAFEQIGVHQVKKEMLAAHSGASPRSSAYTNNLGRLRSLGLIDYPADGYACLTEAGRAHTAGAPAITSLAELHESWYRILPRPQAEILRHAISIYPAPINKVQLAADIDVSASSSAYTNNLGRLRTLGAITYPASGEVRASDLLFPEVLR